MYVCMHVCTHTCMYWYIYAMCIYLPPVLFAKPPTSLSIHQSIQFLSMCTCLYTNCMYWHVSVWLVDRIAVRMHVTCFVFWCSHIVHVCVLCVAQLSRIVNFETFSAHMLQTKAYIHKQLLIGHLLWNCWLLILEWIWNTWIQAKKQGRKQGSFGEGVF